MLSQGRTLVGNNSMKWRLILVLALVVAGLAAPPLFMAAAWVGGKILQVEVLVIDTEEPCAIGNAQVVAFPYRKHPWGGEIAWRKPSDFLPDWDSTENKVIQTDSKGRCSFEYRFWAAGMSGWLRNSGYVDTGRIWLHVSAPGRPTTLVPLDCQTVHPRDIKDNSPLFVTVVLNKNSIPTSEAGASR
jgi:hypothetical protein